MLALSRSSIRCSLRCAVLALIASAVLGGLNRAESGLFTAWDGCGDGKVFNKTFACNTNVGAETLVVSFHDNYNFPRVAHADISVNVCFRQFNVVPDWWQLGTGGCRLGALTLTAASPGAGCAPLWDPAGSSTQLMGPVRGHLVNGFDFQVSVTVSDSAQAPDIVAGQEYQLFRLILDHSRTTGSGACAECLTAAGIGADYVWFHSTDGDNWGQGSVAHATWQDETLFCFAQSPVQNRTWARSRRCTAENIGTAYVARFFVILN
jgi:hypothetical protein